MKVFRFRVSCLSAVYLALIALQTAPAQAVQFSMIPTIDAFLRAAQPTENYGATGSWAFAAAGLPQGEFQSVVRWDMAPAKASFDTTFGAGQWVVQSIGLKLTNAVPMNAIFNASAAGQFSIDWMQNDTWTEGAGTPMAPDNTGIMFGTLASFLSGSDQLLGTYAFSGATSGNATYSIGLVSGLLTDIYGGSLAGMRVYAADTVVAGVVNSRSFGMTGNANRATLLIDAVAVPEPATWLLAGAGCVALVLSRRRVAR